jgi:putative addiction module antidote
VPFPASLGFAISEYSRKQKISLEPGMVQNEQTLRFDLLGSHRPHEARLCHFGRHGATARTSSIKLLGKGEIVLFAPDYNLDYNQFVTKLKIRSIGSSHGVILPKEVLDRLNLGEGDELFVVEAAGELKLTPYNPDFEKVMDAARDIVKRYRNDLRAMAKS